MTSETLSNKSSDKNNQDFDKLINGKLLVNNIRQNKTLIIIAGIILFLARPLVQIISLMNYHNSYTSQPLYLYAENNAQNFGSLVPAAAFILAVVIGLNVTNYMHGRKAAIFYNSIPIKRLSLFATQYLSGLAYFIPVYAVSYILSVMIMPYRSAMGINTEYYLGALIFFILIYSFIILCANIAGTLMNSLLSAVYLCAVVPAVIGIFLGFIEIFYRFTSAYGITESPYFRIIFYPVLIHFPVVFQAHTQLTVLDGVMMLVFSAGLTCLAYLFHRLTKTENAAKPFYFTKFLAVFKYSVLAILIIASGMLFYALSESSILFMFIGIIVGGFVSFLFVNLIIYKNMREVFKGAKQFLILAACTGVIAGVISADIPGIDRHIPDASRVNSISYNNWSHYFGYNFVYRTNSHNYYSMNRIYIADSETIQLVNDVFAAALKSESYEDYRIGYGFDAPYQENAPLRSGTIHYNLKNGGTWTKKFEPYNIRFRNQADSDEFEKAYMKLFESPGYKQAFYSPLTDIDAMREQMDNADKLTVTFTSSGESQNKLLLSDDVTRETMEALIAVLNQDIKNVNLSDIGWQYELTLTFTRSDGTTGIVNIILSDYDFENTVGFLFSIN
jgi:hypothetical protein